jgi:hypothetical protein
MKNGHVRVIFNNVKGFEHTMMTAIADTIAAYDKD